MDADEDGSVALNMPPVPAMPALPTPRRRSSPSLDPLPAAFVEEAHRKSSRLSSQDTETVALESKQAPQLGASSASAAHEQEQGRPMDDEYDAEAAMMDAEQDAAMRAWLEAEGDEEQGDNQPTVNASSKQTSLTASQIQQQMEVQQALGQRKNSFEADDTRFRELMSELGTQDRLQRVNSRWTRMYDEQNRAYFMDGETGTTQWEAPEGWVEPSAPEAHVTAIATAQLYGDVQLDPENLPAHAAAMLDADEDREEDASDAWLQEPWEAPTAEKAQIHRNHVVYEGGTAPLWTTTVEEMTGKIGYGLALYFRFLEALALVLLGMSVLALPALVFNISGDRIPQENQDPMRTIMTQIANMGLNSTYLTTCGSKCAGTVMVLGRPISAYVASLTVTFFDFGYTILFLCFVVYFSVKIGKIVRDAKEQNVTAAAYAVNVSGFPRDATEEEIRDHFSRLYDLSRPDWSYSGACGLIRKMPRMPPAMLNAKMRAAEQEEEAQRAEIEQRRAKKSAMPTSTSRRGGRGGRGRGGAGFTSPTNRNKYAAPQDDQTEDDDAWRPDFHHHADDHDRTRKTVEPVPVTDVSNTGNPTYLHSWVAEVAMVRPMGDAIRDFMDLKELQLRVRDARAKVRKYHTLSPLADERRFNNAMKALNKLEVKLEKMKTARADFDVSHINDCIGAFVIFNEELSWKRCIADFEQYNFGWRYLAQPLPLRFRGKHRLTVRAAPEPSNVIWEHLDTSGLSLFLRRSFSLLCMLALLAATIAVLLYAQGTKSAAQKRLPQFSDCGSNLPRALYYPGSVPSAGFTFQRQRALDGDCAAGYQYLTVAPAPGNHSMPTTPDEICNAGCSSSDDHDQCFVPAAGKIPATHIKRNTIIGCYCKQELQKSMAEMGFIAGANHLILEETDLCGNFAGDYLATQGLFALSAVSVVVINSVLRELMKRLSRFERHRSVTAESSSLALKTFLAQFLNTALVVLLVNANLPSLAIQFNGIGLFVGDYNDFDIDWYNIVGVSICLTMIINTVAPHVMPILNWLLVHPWQRRKAVKKAETQELLNAAFEGSDFQVALRYPVVLNTVFVTLMYSSGIPLLLPLACISVGLTYWVDKVSLLRVCNLPPRYDESLAANAIGLMPYAALLHTAIGTWMYGNDEVTASWVLNAIFGSSEDDFIAWKTKFENIDRIGIVPRLVRDNVAPIFLLLVFLVLWLIAGPFIQRTIRRCVSLCNPQDTDKESREDLAVINSPYTGLYSEVITNAEVTALAAHSDISHKEKQRDLGAHHQGGKYELSTVGDDKVRIRVWAKNGMSHGRHHTAGTRMLTWEVIAETNLFSYNILANPVYRLAMQAIMDVQARLPDSPVVRNAAKQVVPFTPKSPVSTGWSPHGSAPTPSHGAAAAGQVQSPHPRSSLASPHPRVSATSPQPRVSATSPQPRQSGVTMVEPMQPA